MKNSIFTAVFLMGFSFSVMGQDLDQFQYVQIPDKFDFLKEKNKYQLNALTAFLFEKFGFTALYKEPTPKGVQACDVLLANVHNDSGLFRTKLYVTLEDCDKQVVFTSKTGVSREKDYKKSYHEALRNAFKSVEALRHSFTGEVVIDPVVSAEEKKNYVKPSEADSISAEVVIDPVITFEEREELKDPVKTPVGNDVFGGYSNGIVAYELKKIPVGYELFKKGQTKRYARLIRSGGGENYLYSSDSVSGNAYFDADGNLIAEYVDPNSGQVISVIYRKD